MDASSIRTITALTLTIVLELLGFLLFIKSKIPKEEHAQWFIFIIGLNLLTNPLAQVTYYLLLTFFQYGLSWITTELLVIISEAILIRGIMSSNMKTAMIYSLILNGTSILLGGLIWYCFSVA